MWAKTNKIPPWLVDKSPEEVQANVDRRLQYVAEHWGNRCAEPYA